MALPQFVRQLSYSPVLIRAMRMLHLRDEARKWYFHWAQQEDHVLRVSLGTTSGSFVTRTPEQLRAVESGWLCERSLLKYLMRVLRPGDTVYDVGSHMGLYSVLLGKVVGRDGHVVAFEPESHSHATLQENLKLNGLTNVRTFRKALGEQQDETQLYIGRVIGNFSLFPWAVVGGRPQLCSQERVEVVEGDRVRAQERLPVPRVVKIDVEGYEYAVLKGLRETLSRPECEVVCCEIHPTFLPRGVTTEDILGLLQSLGFTLLNVRSKKAHFHALVCKRSSGRHVTARSWRRASALAMPAG